ncbi:transporter substrate-binding domain-containing protein [Pleurocapsales cyanobacterium LEGE 06147]|nr:transporter substrate-binding domain-containing protein [Pleurocapsales cyanobacterium LEGE 06147]
MRQLAKELDAKIEWVWGPENEILEALKHYELDPGIAGLTQSTSWQKEVGITNPYFTDRILVGVPPNLSPIKDAEVEGVQVAVEQENAVVAAYVKKENAVPVRVAEPFQANKPVAAPSWQLEHEIELHEDRHIMAVPPGENGWLMRLERFLSGKRSLITKQDLKIFSRVVHEDVVVSFVCSLRWLRLQANDTKSLPLDRSENKTLVSIL